MFLIIFSLVKVDARSGEDGIRKSKAKQWQDPRFASNQNARKYLTFIIQIYV